MNNFNVNDFITFDKKLSTTKAAVMLSMIEDGKDDAVVDYLRELGLKCVITRAGGRGDNLKDKLFRNSLTAAEHSGVITRDEKAKFVFFKIFSRLLDKLTTGIFSITGAGFKIGIARDEKFISVAISGKVGMPGINIDEEIIEVETDYYDSREE